MKCEACGNEFPSKYYFVTSKLCKPCFEKLNDQEKLSILESIESESVEGIAERAIDGHKLKCPICAHDKFQKRITLMNTPGSTFMGVEWANKQAENFVCDSCGYVFWFLREE
jgi:hypothetical protein